MMKRIALPKIKLKGLGDACYQERARDLELQARKLLKKDPYYSQDRELRIAKAEFREDLEEIGRVKGTAEVRRARRIFRRLLDTALALCPRAREFKWKIAVLDDPEPDQGIAYGCGYIAITKATAALPSEAEVAATLAHEIGHNVCRHSRQEWGVNEIIDNLPAARKGSAKRARKMIQRRNELEADVFSVRLLKAAGYAPEAAIASLERSRQLDGELTVEHKRIHPTYARRIAHIERELKKTARR